MNPVVKAPEDHFTSGGLQDAGDGDVDGSGDHFFGVIDHHHGAVVKIGDALVVLFALLQDKDAHGFAGENDGLEGVGKIVDVEDLHAVELGNLIQIEVVGHDFAAVDLGEFDQLHVDFGNVGEVVFEDPHVQLGHLLNALEDVESTAPAVSFEGVGGIGNHLQFTQDELRNDQGSVEEAGFDDVGDASVDDHAGIEDFEGLPDSLFAAE